MKKEGSAIERAFSTEDALKVEQKTVSPGRSEHPRMLPAEHGADRGSPDAGIALDPVARWCGAATPKRYLRGNHRSCDPEETWSRLVPRLPDFGITRVGDITGLDRVGIPVWIAVRPNSRSLSVSQGKGLHHPAARVSAAMEAIEIACAERPLRRLRYESYRELQAKVPAVKVTALPPARRSLFTADRKIFWIEAHDLMAGTACWVPYELVHTDATVPWMPGSGAFLASTNGLASGNTRAEAVLHGLCEIIERDAMALWEYSGEENQGLTRMDLAAAADPDVQELLERYARAGISVMAWNATSDIGLAVVRCVIFDLSSDPVFRPIPAAFGAGCHPDPNVALLRAMTEAAQSRLTVIAGSRDDFGRLRYRSTQSQEALEYHRWLAQTRPGTVPVDSLPLRTGATVDDDLRNVIELLRRVGAPQVLVIDLGQAELPVSVVRVIVPVLEGPTESSAYLPGPRVRSLLQRLKTS